MSTIGGRPAYRFSVGDNSTGQCSGCGRVFYGEGAFDNHRRGEGDQRGCINPGTPPLRTNGEPEPWWVDSRGRWHHGQRMSDEARERLTATRPNRSPRDGQRCENPTPGVPGTPDDSSPFSNV